MQNLRTARQIAEAVRSGSERAVDVLERHLERLAAQNPRLNAVTATFVERSREAAAAVDRAVENGRDPGALAGVPFTVKENIDLTWSATTHGWRGAADAIPTADATIVARMRAAGAVPIGRGNMPDWGMRWDTDNDLFGRTLNPWDATRTAGGSSGGDAVAVATGMSALGLGNDFGGSLRIPANAVGVCSLRPSFGRVPRTAVVDLPVALTLQQFAVNGPLARTIGDLQAVLPVLMGIDRAHAFGAADPSDPVSIASVPVENAPRRVGVVRDPLGWGVDAQVAASVDRAANALARAGWDIVDIEPPHLEEAITLWRRLACTDMQYSLDPAGLAMPLGVSATAFLRDSTADARVFDSVADYAGAWARRAVIAAEWQRMQQEVPLVLGPVFTTALPPIDYDLGGEEAAGEAWRSLCLTFVANFLGLPAVAVPTGADASGLPTGVQIIGPRAGDEFALAAASDVEAALSDHRNPNTGGNTTATTVAQTK